MELKECDICHAKNLNIYIDGRTLRGPWANMCILCHAAIGVGSGIGKGQMYAQVGNEYVILEG